MARVRLGGESCEWTRLRRTNRSVKQTGGNWQTHMRHRQHCERSRRELHGKRSQVASRRANRSGIETGAGRIGCSRNQIERNDAMTRNVGIYIFDEVEVLDF